MGVTLTEQGLVDDDGHAPAVTCDWLLAIDRTVRKVRQQKEAPGGR